MKKIFAILFFASFYTSQSAAMTDREICKIRAEIVEHMALERDAGRNKKQVKVNVQKAIKKKLNMQLPKSFDIYLDGVFEFREISPERTKDIVLYTCYQEFGLIGK
jgi:hypothetical protein